MSRTKVLKFPSQKSSAPAAEDHHRVEPFITVKQLAERLQVKASTIHEWTRGRNVQSPIPCYRVSRKVLYFRWSEVVMWIEARRAA